MPLLNYSTKVDVFSTIGTIQGKLVKAGAKKILMDYDDNGKIVALSFMIQTPVGLMPFRLPVNAQKVQAVLIKQKVKCDEEQAERVAWRIMKDWIEAQMAILESEMVTLDEIFLPYVVREEDNKTLYQIFKENRLMLGSGGE